MNEENKNNENIPLRKFLLQNFFVLAGIFMAVVNLLLASKLAPLVERISTLEVRAAEIESNLNSSNTLLLKHIDDSNKTFLEINRTLGRVEGNCK